MKPLAAHSWAREPNEHYVEPEWCSARLFAEEKFHGRVWDACCGFGRIAESAKAAGYQVTATDIIDRGYADLYLTTDFLACSGVWNCSIVCNPPFNRAKEFALHALALRAEKIAMVFPVARLNAAHWIEATPLRRVWLMTPRPSMPPGHVISDGGKITGGKTDFCWLVWEREFVGSPELKWLRRDAA